MSKVEVNWSEIAQDPQFLELNRKKSRFLLSMMLFSVFFYFLLPVGAAYMPWLFKIKLFGVVNFGIIFALSQFVVAWGIAFIYIRKANLVFDPLARQITEKYTP